MALALTGHSMRQVTTGRRSQNITEGPDGDAYLKLGQVLEQGLVDGLLAQLGCQDEHALQRQLPQVCIAVREASCHVWEYLALHHSLHHRVKCQTEAQMPC